MPLWVKLLCTLWVGVLVPTYYRHYGPGNFLWFSDIALFMTCAALWIGSPLLVSMAAVSVFTLEIGWNIDFFSRLVTGVRTLGLTDYMFDPRNPLGIRVLSLFHIGLLPLWVWMLRRWGYDPRAWLVQSILCWIVVLLSYLLTKPQNNVNWAYGPLGQPQHRISPRAYVVLVMIVLPTAVYLPTHLVMRYFFRAPK